MLKVTLKNKHLALKEVKKEIRKDINSQMPIQKRLMVQDLRRNTPVDTGEARDGWHSTLTGIENTVEHINALNDGHSQQAPALFIEKTLLSRKGVKPSGIIVRRK